MYGAFFFVALVFIFAAVVIAVLVARSPNRKSRADMKLPAITSEATIVDKRSQLTTSQYGGNTQYFVTFELPNMSRIELAVEATASGQLVVGDYGLVSWSGSTFRGFQRQILR